MIQYKYVEMSLLRQLSIDLKIFGSLNGYLMCVRSEKDVS